MRANSGHAEAATAPHCPPVPTQAAAQLGRSPRHCLGAGTLRGGPSRGPQPHQRRCPWWGSGSLPSCSGLALIWVFLSGLAAHALPLFPARPLPPQDLHAALSGWARGLCCRRGRTWPLPFLPTHGVL